MGGDTRSEKTELATADALTDWLENVLLSYNHPQALRIMLSENIITIDEEVNEGPEEVEPQ